MVWKSKGISNEEIDVLNNVLTGLAQSMLREDIDFMSACFLYIHGERYIYDYMTFQRPEEGGPTTFQLSDKPKAGTYKGNLSKLVKRTGGHYLFTDQATLDQMVKNEEIQLTEQSDAQKQQTGTTMKAVLKTKGSMELDVYLINDYL